MLRIKRVEYSLNTTWSKCMTGARGVLAHIDNNIRADWQHAHCLVAEMVHFVNQLQYYILFEVVESAWSTLLKTTDRVDATLDDLIEAHTRYVNTIVQKGLLASTAEREDGFLVQLHNILKCMLNYREVVESLYSFSVAEHAKRQQLAARIEKRTAAGKWGITEKDHGSRASTPATAGGGGDPWSALSENLGHETPVLLLSNAGDDANLLAGLRKRMTDLNNDYHVRINAFLYDLAHQPDVDLRFLGVVMNFNEAYKPVNPRRQKRKEKGKSSDAQSQASASRPVSAIPPSEASLRAEITQPE